MKIKIIVLISSYPTRYKEFQKNNKKNSKNEKTPLCLLFKPKQGGKGREIVNIKIMVPISSYPTRPKELQKNSKNTIMASFQANIGWERPRKSENKNYRSDQFVPDQL